MALGVLAIDLGTTGVKVAVVDPDGAVLASAGEVLPLLFTADGGAEQDPAGWWDAIGRCSRRAISESPLRRNDITLVAVTTQYASTVVVAADGMPLHNTVMWMDQRGRRHNTVKRDPASAATWLEIHGMVPSGNDDTGHVAFIRAEHPGVYAAAYAFVEPMDYIAGRMTGTVTATHSTMFPMFACDNRVWGVTEYSDVLLDLSGMEIDKLPPLVPMGETRGLLTAAAAEHLGVSVAALLADATIDSVTSAVGTGAIEAERCGLIIGTTSVMVTHLASKRHDLAHGLSTAPSPLTDRFFLVAENGIGGKALDVFVNNVVYPIDGLGIAAPDDAYERVTAAAADVPPGANGVIFQPWLVGSMAPGHQRHVRGGFTNLGLTSNRADMARAVFEGVALNAAWLLPHFSALAERHYDEVVIGGGGAGVGLWGQIMADCFGVRVRRLTDSRTTNARGAALLALAQVGHIDIGDVPQMLTTAETHEPDAAAHACYAERLGAFIDFHDRTAPVYQAMHSRHRTPPTTETPTTETPTTEAPTPLNSTESTS